MDATESANNRVLGIALRSSGHLAQSGEFEAAAKILSNYLSAHAPDALVLRLLGQLHMRLGHPQEAADAFEQALSLVRGVPVRASDVTGEIELSAADQTIESEVAGEGEIQLTAAEDDDTADTGEVQVLALA